MLRIQAAVDELCRVGLRRMVLMSFVCLFSVLGTPPLQAVRMGSGLSCRFVALADGFRWRAAVAVACPAANLRLDPVMAGFGFCPTYVSEDTGVKVPL